MTFTKRGNAKPFGKRLSPSAEMPNHSGNDFRRARKYQTIREMTFAKRGNAKPFGKRLSPSAEMPNLSGNDFRRARKCQTIRKTTFAKRGNAKPFKKWFAGGPQTLYRRRMKVCMMKRSWLIIMKPVRPTLTNAYSFCLIVFLSCAEAWKSFI